MRQAQRQPFTGLLGSFMMMQADSIMPNAFNFSASPFDCLDARRATAGARQRRHRLLPRRRDDPRAGHRADAPVRRHQGPCRAVRRATRSSRPTAADDCFDGRALVAGRASSRFVAAEEVLAYQLAKAAVNALIARNATFGALLFADLSDKLGAIAERHSQREMQALTMARVEEAFLRPAHVVDGDTDIVAVARLMQDERQQRAGARRRRRRRCSASSPAPGCSARSSTAGRWPSCRCASWPPSRSSRISPGAPMFDALALMIQHQVHRLVVADGERIVGLLEQLDLLSFLSNHSYLITVQIVQAQDLDALPPRPRKITRLVALLHRGGTRVGQIGTLVQALNAKLFERALAADRAGRAGRQQLPVRDGQRRARRAVAEDRPGQRPDPARRLRRPRRHWRESCRRFSAALRDFGYPECPGGIMVSNPAWRRSAERLRARRCGSWLLHADPEGLMALAIFLDAHAVAGDAALLAGVRARSMRSSPATTRCSARFAAAIDSFPEASGGWWNRLLLIGEKPSSARST